MIYVEDQLVKVNGVVLPGLVKSIEVKESAKIDEQEVEGSAAKPKQATGYEDAKVNIELIVDDTTSATKYERLATLRALFRKPGQSVPQPIPIISEDTAKHGIDKVLFKGLSHKAESKKGQLAVTLEFWEYVPQTITATKSGGSGGSGSSGSSGSGSTSGLSSNYQDYTQTQRGTAPAKSTGGKASTGAAKAQKKNFSTTAKSAKSPARDDKKPTKALDRVKKMPY